MTRAKAGRPSETQIEQTITEWMGLDGWRAIVTDPKHMRGLGVTEKGIPDRLFIRYGFVASSAEVLWVEFKRTDGKSSQKQKDWHAIERLRGALVWVARVDFPATIEGFQDYYRKSGLIKRRI